MNIKNKEKEKYWQKVSQDATTRNKNGTYIKAKYEREKEQKRKEILFSSK